MLFKFYFSHYLEATCRHELTFQDACAEVFLVPTLSDNYAYLLIDKQVDFLCRIRFSIPSEPAAVCFLACVAGGVSEEQLITCDCADKRNKLLASILRSRRRSERWGDRTPVANIRNTNFQ